MSPGVLGGGPSVTVGGAFTRSHSKAAIDRIVVPLLNQGMGKHVCVLEKYQNKTNINF